MFWKRRAKRALDAARELRDHIELEAAELREAGVGVHSRSGAWVFHESGGQGGRRRGCDGRLANFLGAFSSLALFLAAIGLYELLAFSVSQPTHEIGLRMTIGAQTREVMVSTMWQGRLAGGLSEVVYSLLFGVRATDPLSYIGGAVVLIAAALLATFVPARRASAIDPIVALRYE